MSVTNNRVIEQVDTEIVLVIEDALGGEINDSVSLANEYANQALAHRNAAGDFATDAGEARDTAVDSADTAVDSAAIAVDAATTAAEQATMALTVLPTLVSIAADVIKTQTIVVNHHGFN